MPHRRAPALALLIVLAASAPPALADVVTDWNSIWLDCIRATGGPPCPIARAGAMVHAAVFDAVNAIDGLYEPYLFDHHVSHPTSPEAAAAQAARDVLVALYPSRRAILDAALSASLGQVPNGSAKKAGVALGHEAAKAILEARKDDGSDDITPYPFGSAPGDWQLTPPDFSAPASPNWGRVKPWVITGGDQFRPVGPLGSTDIAIFLASPGYAQLFNEVKELGARNSATRTPYQTQTAYFWANDVNGTYKPPGHLNAIAQVLAGQQHNTLIQNARLFALLNIALADAGIVAWDCKYDTGIDLWRPVTGIRLADLDGNPATDMDGSWEPLNAFTPPFPAYISGHATFAGTAARIFGNFFGTDAITHTISTDEPLYTGAPRTFNSFLDAALENARSRIYLGVHWQCDADDGIAAGTALGDYVYGHILRDPNLVDVSDARAGAPVVESSLRMIGQPKGSATFELTLGSAGRMRLSILDVQGRHVATIEDGVREAGPRRAWWDGHDASGTRVPVGFYVARLEAAGKVRSAKVILIY